jgi:hypothetical protein
MIELYNIRDIIAKMIKKFFYSILVVLIVAIMEIIGAFAFYKTYSPKPQNNLSVYDNIKYGFTFEYPDSLTPQSTFDTFYHLSNKWRAEIFTENPKGVQIVSIPVFRIDNNSGIYKSYPLYYSAEVRIGASSDSQDVNNCLLSSPGNTTTSTDEIINGITFKKFPVENSGMMQYLHGFSYRVVHNSVCFAVEQLAVGSSYRDATSSGDISETTLSGYFDESGEIIKTFKFTK